MSTLSEDQLVKRIKAHIEKGDQAKEKGEQHYAAAGLLLKDLKKDCPNKAAWEELIKTRCGIGTSRAYEWIAIADGRTTAGDLRLATNARKQKHRASRPVRNGQNKAAEPAAAAVDPAAEPGCKSEPAAEERHCSFCHKSEKEVRILMGSSCSAEICHDCVEWFHENIAEPTADLIAYDERRREEIADLAARLIDRDPEIAREVEKVLSDEVFGRHEAAFCLARAINYRSWHPAAADGYPDMPDFLKRAPQDVAA
jgi:hypothetical protein